MSNSLALLFLLAAVVTIVTLATNRQLMYQFIGRSLASFDGNANGGRQASAMPTNLTASSRTDLVSSSSGETAVECADESSGTCCFPWDGANTDAWWLHRPEWLLSSENDGGFCFTRIQDDQLVNFIRDLHYVQWKGNCSDVRYRWVANSGYAATFTFILKGWLTHFQDRVPMQWGLKWSASIWRFANGVCESNDMSCYFLPMSHCVPKKGLNNSALPEVGLNRQLVARFYRNRFLKRRLLMRHYFSRPQQWIRRHVFEYGKAHVPTVMTPCFTVHVRRTDVALERGERTYLPLQTYLKAGNITEGSNIVLLTDDRSAIEEAHEYHPNYNWMYLNRTRFKGSEGGREAHLPSNDPLTEVVAIMSEMKMAAQCGTFVYSQSGFADYILDEMRLSGKQVDAHCVSQNSKFQKSANSFFEELTKHAADQKGLIVTDDEGQAQANKKLL